jgi:hypothetical protein
VPRQKVKALVFQARTSLAASRKARETPCAEIREQVANLRGGALRRTTLHRHLRECAGCRAFRDEVALQRKTLAVALPVIPTVGLKEAALGAAFGSGSAGGGAAAVSASGALTAKALVTVALVGGGTTAGVQAARDAVPLPRAAERSAHASPAPAAVGSAVTTRHVSAAPHHVRRPTPRGATAPPAAARPRATAPKAAVPAAAQPQATEPADREPAAKADEPAPADKPTKADRPPKAEKPPKTPPGQAKPMTTPPGQAKKAQPKPPPPGQAKKLAPAAAEKPGKPSPTPPGQAKKPAPVAPALPLGHIKKLVPLP